MSGGAELAAGDDISSHIGGGGVGGGVDRALTPVIINPPKA